MTRADWLTGLRSWWRLRRQRREQRRREVLENRILLELRRAAYGSDVPASVSIMVLADRFRLSASELHPVLDDLVARRLILPGLTPGDSYRIRGWTLDSQ